MPTFGAYRFAARTGPVPLAGVDGGHTLDQRGMRYRDLSRLLRMQAALGFKLLGPARFNKDT